MPLLGNHEPVIQDNSQTLLWTALGKNYCLSTKLRCITVQKETSTLYERLGLGVGQYVHSHGVLL